jgi:hypothetical protein
MLEQLRGPAIGAMPAAARISTTNRTGRRRPNRHARRREKVFGDGPCIPRDRNAKQRIQTLARAKMHPTEPHKHYGPVTAKFFAVLNALLWDFHNSITGRCFPSYAAIAAKAHCDETTVGNAIAALEDEGLLKWVNRIRRVREPVAGLFGKDSATRERVIRTSNAYVLIDPQPSKPKITGGTTNQNLILLELNEPKRQLDPTDPLQQALNRLEAGVKGTEKEDFRQRDCKTWATQEPERYLDLSAGKIDPAISLGTDPSFKSRGAR